MKPTPTETLHTCPKCSTPNFTARGIKAHVCKAPDSIIPIEQATGGGKELQNCVSRFRIFHDVVKGNVLAMKLAKFFGGIEVQTLCDLHSEMFGETRGQFAEESKTDSKSVLLEPFLEGHLGVTARTARRYKNHFTSCTQDKPELAEKLRKWWLKWKDDAALQIAGDSTPAAASGDSAETQIVSATSTTLALHEVCNLAAKDMQELLDHADEWGLSELFEVPLKDVTEEDATPEPPTPPDAKERLAKFWLKDFSRRAMNNEFLKLRKQDREALLTTWEEATAKLKDSLATKGGSK